MKIALACASLVISTFCLIGTPGCGPASNEENFTETPGIPDPNAPQTQEEYDKKFQKE